MVDFYLKDLVTEHPGGWQDIIDFVNAHYDRYQATYKSVDAKVDVTPAPYNKNKEELRALRVYSSREENKELPRLEQICHSISGVAASMGWAVLKALELPIPGHKNWMKPCSKWRKDEKS